MNPITHTTKSMLLLIMLRLSQTANAQHDIARQSGSRYGATSEQNTSKGCWETEKGDRSRPFECFH